MLPKSSKGYIKIVAEQLGESEDLVRAAVDTYYSRVRKALSELECSHIQIECLGMFKVKPKELYKSQMKYEKHLSVLSKETFTQMAIRKETELKLERVLKLKKLIGEESDRRAAFFKKKNDENQNPG